MNIVLLVCLISSVSSTLFHPKYGKPKPPFGSPLLPHGIQRSPFGGRGPIAPIVPIIHPAPFPPKVLWTKKVDPRTGNIYKMMRRKPFNPGEFKHFTRKAHYARKVQIHKLSKLKMMPRSNMLRGGKLSMRSPHFIKGHPSRYPTQRMIRKPPILGHPGGMMPSKSRPALFPHVQPQRHIRPNMVHPPFNAVPTQPQQHHQLNRQLIDRIDNTFDDRFDDGFGPAIEPIPNNAISGHMNNHVAPIQHNDIQPSSFHQSFMLEVNANHHRQSFHTSPSVSPVGNLNNHGAVGGFQRQQFQQADDMFRHGARNNILNSFDDKPVIDGAINKQNEGSFGSQQPFHHEMNRQFTQQNFHQLPQQNHHGFIDMDFGIDSVFDHETDGFIDDIGDNNDRLEGVSNIASRVNDVLEDIRDMPEELNLVKGPLDFIYEQLDLSGEVDSITDLQKESEHRLERQFDDVLDSDISDVAKDIKDSLNDFNPLRGIGGILQSESDDGIIHNDDGPISGLQLLGPSSWQDVLTELENVGTQFDTLQMSHGDIRVLPVNPHSKEEIFTSKERDLFNHDVEFIPEIDSETVPVGSFALLGIDPASIHASEIQVDETSKAPEHPPPIPLPNSANTLQTQDQVSDSTKQTATSVTDNISNIADTSNTLANGHDESFNNVIDTMNKLTLLTAIKDLDIAS